MVRSSQNATTMAACAMAAARLRQLAYLQQGHSTEHLRVAEVTYALDTWGPAGTSCLVAPVTAPPTFQAGDTRPPRWDMISAESSQSRPSRCAVASRVLTRQPRPRAGSYEEDGGGAGYVVKAVRGGAGSPCSQRAISPEHQASATATTAAPTTQGSRPLTLR